MKIYQIANGMSEEDFLRKLNPSPSASQQISLQKQRACYEEIVKALELIIRKLYNTEIDRLKNREQILEKAKTLSQFIYLGIE